MIVMSAAPEQRHGKSAGTGRPTALFYDTLYTLNLQDLEKHKQVEWL